MIGHSLDSHQFPVLMRVLRATLALAADTLVWEVERISSPSTPITVRLCFVVFGVALKWPGRVELDCNAMLPSSIPSGRDEAFVHVVLVGRVAKREQGKNKKMKKRGCGQDMDSDRCSIPTRPTVFSPPLDRANGLTGNDGNNVVYNWKSHHLWVR